MFQKTNLFLTAVFSLIILSFSCSSRSEGLKQTDIEPLINTFLAHHVVYNEFTDEISERTLDNIITYLDPWKIYFTKSDIKTLEKDKDSIDNFVDDSDYDFLFNIYALYRKRFSERMDYVDQLLKADYDFTVDESISSEPDKVQFTDTDTEIKDRWRKTIKYQLLQYINIGKTIDEAKAKVTKRYAMTRAEEKKLTADKMYATLLNSFATALDPHTNYMSPDEWNDFRISMTLKLGGIGAQLRSEDGYVIVDSIMPNSPSSRLPEGQKLLPNDKIVAVAQGDAEPEDVIDMPLNDAVNLIRGTKGTTVKLTVIREGADKKTTKIVIPIVRDIVVLENQSAKSEMYKTTRNGKNYNIGYIRLPAFYFDEEAFKNNPNAKMSSRDVYMALNALTSQGCDAVVLDLRGNLGGALIDAIRISGFFIKDGPIVLVKSHDRISTNSDDDPNIYYTGPLVILIDSLSASASEIVSGALKDYKRALIIGHTTFGKGSVQNTLSLSANKGGMKVTTELFYQPSGNSNYLNGITPDIEITDLTDVLDMSEKKLKYPLKWSPIKTSYYETFGESFVNPALVSDLASRSRDRIKKDKDFVSLAEKIAKYRKQISESTVSLKKQDTSKIDQDIENQQKQKEERLAADKKVIDLTNDIFLREAFNVTVDYVGLLDKK